VDGAGLRSDILEAWRSFVRTLDLNICELASVPTEPKTSILGSGSDFHRDETTILSVDQPCGLVTAEDPIGYWRHALIFLCGDGFLTEIFWNLLRAAGDQPYMTRQVG